MLGCESHCIQEPTSSQLGIFARKWFRPKWRENARTGGIGNPRKLRSETKLKRNNRADTTPNVLAQMVMSKESSTHEAIFLRTPDVTVGGQNDKSLG